MNLYKFYSKGYSSSKLSISIFTQHFIHSGIKSKKAAASVMLNCFFHYTIYRKPGANFSRYGEKANKHQFFTSKKQLNCFFARSNSAQHFTQNQSAIKSKKAANSVMLNCFL